MTDTAKKPSRSDEAIQNWGHQDYCLDADEAIDEPVESKETKAAPKTGGQDKDQQKDNEASDKG